MLSSLIAGLTNHRPEQQFVRNLDHALKLSRGGEESLVFPARMSKVLWGNLSVYHNEVEILKDVNASKELRTGAAKTILTGMPEYFAYAAPEEIIADLLQYFDFIGTKPAVQ